MDDVTVIMSVYKRPYSFKEQYEKIKNQTYKNINTVIWINKAEGVSLSQDILNNPESVYSETNHGVWGRFGLAEKYNTKYICIIDDDTIPGIRWIENCINTIKTHPGVITTRGVVSEYGTDFRYPNPSSYTAFGWGNPNKKTIQVDMGCHCWFFEKELLQTFWATAPKELPMNHGEDMHLSYAAQLDQKGTFVPPHPENDLDMWGSHPNTGHSYGSDKNAISWNNQANLGMNKYWNALRKKGFRIIAEM